MHQSAVPKCYRQAAAESVSYTIMPLTDSCHVWDPGQQMVGTDACNTKARNALPVIAGILPAWWWCTTAAHQKGDEVREAVVDAQLRGVSNGFSSGKLLTERHTDGHSTQDVSHAVMAAHSFVRIWRKTRCLALKATCVMMHRLITDVASLWSAQQAPAQVMSRQGFVLQTRAVGS